MSQKQEMKITGHTGLYGLVADPIKHSFSPMMHNQAFETLEIDDVYMAFEVHEKDFPAYMASVRHLEMKGFNVSMPYKEKIVDYMDELTERSKLCHAVNTVKNENGRLIGHITDGIGFLKACDEQGWHVQNQKIVILGAGGAAKAIIVELALSGVQSIIVYNRSHRPYIEELHQKLKCDIELKSLQDHDGLKKDLQDAYLLIQTTNVGMKPHEDQCLISHQDILPQHLKVADIIYNPKETKLIKMAKEKGLEYMNGEGMILHQASASFAFWTNQEMPISEVRKRLEKESEK